MTKTRVQNIYRSLTSVNDIVNDLLDFNMFHKLNLVSFLSYAKTSEMLQTINQYPLLLSHNSLHKPHETRMDPVLFTFYETQFYVVIKPDVKIKGPIFIQADACLFEIRTSRNSISYIRNLMIAFIFLSNKRDGIF